MKITRLRASELDLTLAQRWRSLSQADPSLASPYFCLDYVQAVAQVRDDVFVAVVENDGAVQGFFPFQCPSRKVAAPVGGRLSDCHGFIGAAHVPGLDATALMRAAGIDIWDFDHVPAAQQLFAAHATRHDESPIMDVSQGYDRYLEQRKAAGAQRVAQMLRKARKFEREVGALRFEADCRDRRAFEQTVQWKREQCLRTGVPDFLSWGWTVELLERIWAADQPGFAGRLSVLWHDDVILAAHFGMRSHSVWHWWFPGYNAGYSDHSPGGILLLRVAEAAAQAGMSHVDLGKGEDAYKRSFATGSIPLIEGAVLVPSLTSTWRRTREASRGFLRDSPVMSPARTAYRQLRGWMSPRHDQTREDTT
jgi:CelD/BcsL family acetyltransferase involved in cellulose biosynthesis